jgi:hypothetical protein
MGNSRYDTNLNNFKKEVIQLDENFETYLDKYINLYPSAKVYTTNNEIQNLFSGYKDRLDKNQTDLELLLSKITDYFDGLNTDTAKLQVKIDKLKRDNDVLEVNLTNLKNSNNAATGIYEQFDFNLHTSITYNIIILVSSLIIFYITYKKMISKQYLSTTALKYN